MLQSQPHNVQCQAVWFMQVMEQGKIKASFDSHHEHLKVHQDWWHWWHKCQAHNFCSFRALKAQF